MGQYYLIANVDKKEFLNPHSLDNGAKLMEWSYQGNRMVNALFNLLQTDWQGDRVYVVGDYADSEELNEADVNWLSTYNAVAEELGFKGKLTESGYEHTLYSYVDESFKNISNEVDSERIEGGARYIFNNQLKCVVDLAKLPVTYEGFDRLTGKPYCMYISPLSLLLAMGNGRGGGDYHNCYPAFNEVGLWCESSQEIEVSRDMLHPDYDEFEVEFSEMEAA